MVTPEKNLPEDPKPEKETTPLNPENTAPAVPEAPTVDAPVAVTENKQAPEVATKVKTETENTPAVEAPTTGETEKATTVTATVATVENEAAGAGTPTTNNEENVAKDGAAVDCSALSKEELIAFFKKTLKSKPIPELRDAVEKIRSEFHNKYNDEEAKAKAKFLEEGGNIIDFHYRTPLKKEFNNLYFDYKEKRSAHYKNVKKDRQQNLAKREELIEELKSLLRMEENIGTTYKHFKDIQERWHTAGAIPRDKHNIVWNTYHHHVENFYDFLHLNREFRDLDFKHNLEQKLRLINRAEELAQEENISKAFRELQMLHKMWKEEIGPVAKAYRDEVWEKFSAATKVIHDKRAVHQKELDAVHGENLEKKNTLIAQITTLAENTEDNHGKWQKAIKQVQGLRDEFFSTGKVPKEKNKAVWNAFKEAGRKFNHAKNNFYKKQKEEQYANLQKKRELIAIAIANKDSDDPGTATPLMKKIQDDWKKVGFVPRKESDKVWKEFKDACNHYFDRINAKRNGASEEETANLEAKTQLLASLDTVEITGNRDEDLPKLKEKIAQWRKIGRVPRQKKQIDQKFNKALDALFVKLDLSKKEVEMIRYENKLNTFKTSKDDRQLQNEQYFINKKIDEEKSEIRQLENNLGFFQHVPDDNPMVKKVHNNIARHKAQLEVWQAKLKKIKSVRDHS
ncbi:MAG: DUF349 domain-containing protein [Marinirhabdus sp.]